LNDNQLSKIKAPTTNEMFKKLTFLRIENNLINGWSSFDALDLFPNLTKLRCKENPIFKGKFDLFRDLNNILSNYC
jgi:hypothetical protein